MSNKHLRKSIQVWERCNQHGHCTNEINRDTHAKFPTIFGRLCTTNRQLMDMLKLEVLQNSSKLGPKLQTSVIWRCAIARNPVAINASALNQSRDAALFVIKFH